MVIVRRAELKDAEAAVGVVRRSIAELCTDDHYNDADTLTNWLTNKTPENFRSWISNPDNFFVNRRTIGNGYTHVCYKL